ncbi:aspartate/glutamate racemase family protein [uncultured Tateyamaria sp.]|uniref:aspartate/glutamate racemase family protein n=1 Tax=uncultured Tateyamaria sp. TaxID=455651 RepID=UPI00261456AC|nr:aspartate/glutamate racemase family protein [uncultured Tateyamaria sp.]
MAIVIINPNSTTSMTEAMVSVAQSAAPDLTFEGWTSEKGSPSIQGPEDGEAAAPHLLDLVDRASAQGAEGIIIGCFDDTALKEASQRVSCPVIGIGQASYHYAAMRGWRFSVVTTLAVSVPVLEANIRNQGLGHAVAKVRASNVPVLELEADPMCSARTIGEEALRAEQDDDISAVILGCAGMVQVVAVVRDALKIETIDPVACAAKCLKWMT